ncbi:hypothetical protein H4582DRAFT_1149959 [Lactarius indigo]|nr:hypothetical protein H4582DRAFT_1149959 [Lactarius indigo]
MIIQYSKMYDEPANKETVTSLGDKLQGDSSFVKDLGPFFDEYSEMALAEDKEMMENWNAVARDNMTISGLFSAVVATFLVVSFQDLRPDPQDKSAAYLENIYQLLADSNRTHDVPTFPSQSFSPPKSAVWVNSLWSLSLVITLSSALLAILVQQWVRRYIKVTQPRSASGPHKRARDRAFFDKGVEDLRLRWVVDALPIFLHTSLVLFLAGFIIFSFGYNHTVLKVVVSWVGLCAVMYACFTLLPLIRHDSPYYTPLSPPFWLIYTGTLYVTFRILRWCTAFNLFSEETWNRFGHSEDHYGRRFLHRIEEAAEESIQKSPSEIDGRILLWALQSSGDIPDFRDSNVLDEFRGAFETSNGEEMTDVLIGLMDCTLSSDLVTRSTKEGRIKNYIAAMVELSLPISQRTLERVLYKDWGALLDSVDFGLLLRNTRYSDLFVEYYSQCMVAVIIARVNERDDRWFELVTGQLGISKSTLDSYLDHGDSVLLANCIFICRRTLDAYSEHRWPRDVYSRSKTMELASRFDVQGVLPELRHKFCDMWNELVRNTRDRRSRNLSIYILKHIRSVYFELHRDTIAVATAFTDKTLDDDIILVFPSSYPSCEISRHHPDPCPVKVEVVCVKRSEEPSTDDGSSVLPAPAHARAKPNSRSLRFPPSFPSPNPFSVIWDDACTRATAFCPSVTPHTAYTASSSPSIPLSGTSYPRKRASSNNSDPHPRSVLRKDGLSGSLVDDIRGTTPTSASSTAGSISDALGAVSALPHPFTAIPSSSGSIASRGSARLRFSPHAVHDTPSLSLPISGNTLSQSSSISSMSRSNYVPLGTISLVENDSTALPATTAVSAVGPCYNSRSLSSPS